LVAERRALRESIVRRRALGDDRGGSRGSCLFLTQRRQGAETRKGKERWAVPDFARLGVSAPLRRDRSAIDRVFPLEKAKTAGRARLPPSRAVRAQLRSREYPLCGSCSPPRRLWSRRAERPTAARQEPRPPDVHSSRRLSASKRSATNATQRSAIARK